MISIIQSDEYIVSLLKLIEKHSTISGKIKILIELARLDYCIDSLSFNSIFMNRNNFLSILAKMIQRNSYRDEIRDREAGLITDYTIHELKY